MVDVAMARMFDLPVGTFRAVETNRYTSQTLSVFERKNCLIWTERNKKELEIITSKN